MLICSNLMRTEGCQGSIQSAALSTVQCEERSGSHQLITYCPHAGRQEPAGRLERVLPESQSVHLSLLGIEVLTLFLKCRGVGRGFPGGAQQYVSSCLELILET